jgi:ATP-dependent DNA helicase RecG
VRANPKVIIQKLAHTLGVTDRTIKRTLKSLQESNRIKRVGARKTGHWEIIDKPDSSK